VTFPPEVQQMLQGGSEEKVEETEPFLKGVPTIQEHTGSLREHRREKKKQNPEFSRNDCASKKNRC